MNRMTHYRSAAPHVTNRKRIGAPRRAENEGLTVIHDAFCRSLTLRGEAECDCVPVRVWAPAKRVLVD